MNKRILAAAGLLLGLALGMTPSARAATPTLAPFDFNNPTFTHSHPFAKAHVVIQVSQDSPAVWTLTLNNAKNLLDYFGPEQVQIVVVAYGPGLKIFFDKSPVAQYIASLDAEGVEFDACHNTYEAFTKALGKAPVLVPQAVMVPAGVVRIMQLEQHGFDYIRP